MYVLITTYDNAEDFNPMENNYIRNDRGAKRKFRSMRTARKYGEQTVERMIKNNKDEFGMVRMDIEDAWEIDNGYYQGAIESKEVTA